MKVLNVSTTFDPVTGGGEAERSFQLTKYLTKAGVDCRVLTIDTGLSAERKNLLAPGKIVALPCLFRRFYIPKFSFGEIKKIVMDADIIHLMGHWSLLNAIVYLAIKIEKKPYVICPAGSLTIFGRSKIIKTFYNFIIGNSIIKNAARVIAVTQAETLQFLNSGVKKEKILVIPNGIAASDFESAETENFKNKYKIHRPFILFLGRLNLIKGPDLLLQSFINIKDKFTEYDLVFVGPDGGLLPELKQSVHNFNLKHRVHFIGYLGGAEKSDALHAANFLVVPSRHEAMSIVALEAGICGTPVLLTDQCGFNEISQIGGGWVVPANVEGLVQGLTEIFADAEPRKQASLKIKTFVTENYSWDFIIKKYLSAFEDI